MQLKRYITEVSEEDIKRVTLRYLKSHYRYRSRSGETELSSDMRGAGGIIADGYLQFFKEDESSFLATFEATSYQTRDEVRFKIQGELLNWDSLSFALATLAICFSWTYIRHNYFVKEWGIYPTIYVLLAATLVFFALYRLLFRGLKRYRYIYAVEQFKRYHADEQWIALGQDVFLKPDDKYLAELKKQCVRYGFGLVMVDFDLVPRPIITPSREEVFGASREIISFITQNELTKRIQQTTTSRWWPKSKWLNRIREFFSQRRTSLSRFKRTYYNQIFLSIICIVVVGVMIDIELKEQPIAYEDEALYEQKMLDIARKKRFNKEPIGYSVDSAFIRPYNPKESPYLTLSKRKIDDPIPIIRKSGNEVVVSEEGGGFTYYDCERFYTFQKAKYMVTDGAYPSFERAKNRVDGLIKKEIEASIIWMGCFTDDNGDYMVYLGYLMNSFEEAEREKAAYQILLNKKSIQHRLGVEAILPKKNK